VHCQFEHTERALSLWTYRTCTVTMNIQNVHCQFEHTERALSLWT